MKRLLALAAAAAALCAHAALERVATVQITDTIGLVKAATKAGELTGYPMLGSMASMSLAENPLAEAFGPMREGASALFVVYADVEKAVAKPDDFEPEVAVVYPPEQSKLAFLAAHPGAVETDGVIAVKDEDDDDDTDDDDDDEDGKPSEPDYTYFAFSEDGKWATMSDERDLAKRALAEAATAQRDMDGDFVRLYVTPDGLKVLRAAFDETAKELNETGADFAPIRALLKEAAALDYGLRLGDAGLDARCTVKVEEGSVLAKSGLTPLAGDALAFAPADALVAVAAAANTGYFGTDKSPADQCKALTALMEKYGLKTDWFKCESAGEGTVQKWTFDIPASVAYFKGEGKAALEKLDKKAFKADWLKASGTATPTLRADSPAASVSVALAGHPAKLAPAAKFAKVLPEAAAKKPYMIGSYSIYALFKAALAEAVTLADDKTQAQVKPMLASLPGNEDGAVALALWRDGDAHQYHLRISADEIRGLSAIGTSTFTYAMMRKMFAPSSCAACGECDDGDDDDDDKDDDDKDDED